MTILITGGLGFIGSHTVVSLLQNNQDVLIIDQVTNEDLCKRLVLISGKDFIYEQVDLLNKAELVKVFQQYSITSVIHFAAFKSLSESYKQPLLYYANNLISTLNLLEVMQEYQVKKIVFSSSAIIYGDKQNVPLEEDSIPMANNPYAQTKLMVEQVFRDLATSDKEWHILALRYFNPIGAHPSGIIGEDLTKQSNNLMPLLLKVAAKQQNYLNIFGDEYDTIDGTCIRDYIHVMDIAEGHVKALEYVEQHSGFDVVNLGTGKGISVLQLVKTFAKVNDVKIPYRIVEPRKGDIGKSYASIEKMKKILKWQAKYSIEDMCRDAWKWKVRGVE